MLEFERFFRNGCIKIMLNPKQPIKQLEERIKEEGAK